MKAARKAAQQVKRSRMDLGSRQEVKAAEAAAAARRRATWISKQVAGFWKKAQQVVNYKVCVAGCSYGEGRCFVHGLWVVV